MDREAENFRFRVQEKVDLADDEIIRLKNYLELIEQQKIEIKQKIQNRKNAIFRKKSSNLISNNKISKSIAISKIKSEFDSVISCMYQKHQDTITSMRKQFSEDLETINSNIPKKINFAVTQYEKQIEAKNAEKSKIIHNQTQISETIKSDFNTIHQLEYKRIQELEKYVKENNEERKRSLEEAKDRFSETIALIETCEKRHNLKISNIIKNIDKSKKIYQQKIKNENEKHKEIISVLNRQLKQSEDQVTKYEIMIKDFEKKNSARLTNVKLEVQEQSLKQKNYSSKQYEIHSSERENLLSHYQQLQDRLKNFDNRLIDLRTQNESLKREVARMKHEKNFNQLFQTLNHK